MFKKVHDATDGLNERLETLVSNHQIGIDKMQALCYVFATVLFKFSFWSLPFLFLAIFMIIVEEDRLIDKILEGVIAGLALILFAVRATGIEFSFLVILAPLGFLVVWNIAPTGKAWVEAGVRFIRTRMAERALTGNIEVAVEPVS